MRCASRILNVLIFFFLIFICVLSRSLFFWLLHRTTTSKSVGWGVACDPGAGEGEAAILWKKAGSRAWKSAFSKGLGQCSSPQRLTAGKDFRDRNLKAVFWNLQAQTSVHQRHAAYCPGTAIFNLFHLMAHMNWLLKFCGTPKVSYIFDSLTER